MKTGARDASIAFAKTVCRYDSPLSGKYIGQWHTAKSVLEPSCIPRWYPSALYGKTALVWFGIVLYIPKGLPALPIRWRIYVLCRKAMDFGIDEMCPRCWRD